MKKIKLFTRIASLALVVLMVLGIVSCGKKVDGIDTGASKDTVSTDQPPVEGGDKFEVPEVDYDGMKFYILVSDNPDHTVDFAAQMKKIEANTSTLDRAVFNRNERIEKQFNIDIECLIAAANTEINTNITTAVGSGSDVYHLVALHGQQTFNHIMNQRAVDWNTLEYVNLDNSWWNQSARSIWATPGGKVFAMNGDISHMSVGNINAIYWNKTMFEAVPGLTTPAEHVKAETWTFENFKKTIMELDASVTGTGSGSLADDSFAYASQRYRGPSLIIPSTGAYYIKLNSNGKYAVDIDNDRVITAVEQYLDLINSDVAVYDASGIGRSGGIRQGFKAGRIALTVDNVKCATSFAGAGLNYGIVPTYKYDDNVEDVWSEIGSGTNTFMVLINTLNETRVKISVILEAFAYYGQRDIISVYYDTILKYQTMPTAEDLEMLEAIHDSAAVSMAGYGNFGKISEIVWRTQEGEYSSIATAIASVKGPALLELDLFYSLDDWWDSLDHSMAD